MKQIAANKSRSEIKYGRKVTHRIFDPNTPVTPMSAGPTPTSVLPRFPIPVTPVTPTTPATPASAAPSTPLSALPKSPATPARPETPVSAVSSNSLTPPSASTESFASDSEGPGSPRSPSKSVSTRPYHPLGMTLIHKHDRRRKGKSESRYTGIIPRVTVVVSQ